MELECYKVVDGNGNETNGLTYKTRKEALKYALQENGRYIKKVGPVQFFTNQSSKYITLLYLIKVIENERESS